MNQPCNPRIPYHFTLLMNRLKSGLRRLPVWRKNQPVPADSSGRANLIPSSLFLPSGWTFAAGVAWHATWLPPMQKLHPGAARGGWGGTIFASRWRTVPFTTFIMTAPPNPPVTAKGIGFCWVNGNWTPEPVLSNPFPFLLASHSSA